MVILVFSYFWKSMWKIQSKQVFVISNSSFLTLFMYISYAVHIHCASFWVSLKKTFWQKHWKLHVCFFSVLYIYFTFIRPLVGRRLLDILLGFSFVNLFKKFDKCAWIERVDDSEECVIRIQISLRKVLIFQAL